MVSFLNMLQLPYAQIAEIFQPLQVIWVCFPPVGLRAFLSSHPYKFQSNLGFSAVPRSGFGPDLNFGGV